MKLHNILEVDTAILIKVDGSKHQNNHSANSLILCLTNELLDLQ